jgi:hypothetical protein
MKSKIIFLLPIILSMIISLQWMVDLGVLARRSMIGFILGSILWSFYILFKNPSPPVKSIIMVTVMGFTSFLLLIITLLKTGW